MQISFKTLLFIFFIPLLLLIFPLHSQAEEEVSAQEKDIRLVDDGNNVTIEDIKERILKGEPVLSVGKQEEAKRTIRPERITNALKKEHSVKKNYLGICLVTPPNSLKSSIFGFAQFISALALLVIVFTISGIRYRFRIAVAPIPLFTITFYLIGFIGFGTLFTDIWFAMQWPTPNFLINQSIWQGVFG